MFKQKKLLFFITLPLAVAYGQVETTLEQEAMTTSLRGPENKSFNNTRVYHTLHTKNIFVEEDTVIGNNLKVNGGLISEGSVSGPTSSTPNALPRFADDTGSIITNSPVVIDDAENVSGINTLTANLITADLNGTASTVNFISNQTAEAVAAATILLHDATNNNTYSALAQRDNTGSFATTMITITGIITNATDIATKEYVDALTSSTFFAKTPADAASGSNVASLSGSQIIDGVSLIAGNRVLLLNQTDPVKNGLWQVAPGSWVRPSDFTPGTEAGKAYVFVLGGTTLGSTAWICSTPSAIIGTDPLSFVAFPLLGQTTGANVGSGTGTLFKDKTGVYINIKSLLGSGHLIVENALSGDEVILSTTAFSEDIPNTLVLRDPSGNFLTNTLTAAITGTASENILRSGDTMTGTLTLPTGTPTNPSLQFESSSNTGLSAAGNKLSISTNSNERMSIDAVGTVTITSFTTNGIVHNSSSGEFSSSLIINDDVDNAANIVDTKLATISTSGKVLDFATTATSLNYPSTIVRRDADGNLDASNIIATTLIGTFSDSILRSGDTMTGTFTVMAGTASNPSLQIVGSTHTGLSAEQPNRLSFNTNGVEQMSINETGTITIPGTLMLAAGSEEEPSLQFIHGTNTGLSSPTPNTISFDVNGIERMRIDENGVYSPTAAFVINNVMSLTATQSLNITNYGTYPVTIENDTSMLIINYISSGPITVDITFPSDPYEGQLVMIKAILTGSSNNLNLTYNYTFYPETEELILLNPFLAPDHEYPEPYRVTGGSSVTYIYHTTATGFPKDGWYRYSRS